MKHLNQIQGSVGQVLTTRTKELNQITTNFELINFLESSKSIVEEPFKKDLYKLINDVQNQKSFSRNIRHIYNYILAGDGLRSY